MSPWSVRNRRRRRSARAALLSAMALTLVGLISSAQATPANQDAEAVGNALESFADRLASASDALGEYQDLANSLPLTDLAPGDPEALDLSNLLDGIFTPANLGTFDDMPDLATAVDALDGTYGGVTVQFGSGGFGQPAVSSTAGSLTIPIHATRTVNEPLAFKFGSVDMAGGSLGVDFVLNTTLTFNVDPTAFSDADAAPATAVSLAPPTIALCANATGSVGIFTARFGFTDVKVSTDDPNTPGTETAKLHACANVVFHDPDSTGGITRDEWTSHALTELASANLVKGNPSGDDLDIKLFADATLVNGDAFATNTAADASTRFQDADLSSAPAATPSVAVGPGLQAWLNITAGDVANGLAQFVSSLSAAQGKGDAPLPLVGKSLTELFDGVKPLLDYTDKLISATVACGTIPGDATHLPTGVVDNLATGTPVFCRAQTQQAVDPTTVDWQVPADVAATLASNGTNDATIAQNPTLDAAFTMTAPGNFSVNATWKSGGKAKSAIPRPTSAQELFARLTDAAGLDDDLLNLGYDASTTSLTFHLKPDAALDPASLSVDASIGDLLRNTTNLAGLKQLSAGLNADVDDVDFDVTFGVLLNASTSDITPLRGSADSGGVGTFADADADFTDGVNDPQLGQVVKKTTAPTGQCTITTIAEHALTCAAGPSNPTWGSSDGYDVDGGLIDRFFVKVNPGAPELSVGDISLDGNATLSGTVGFVAIEAGGDGAKNTFTSTNPKKAFEIAKADGADPALAVDIKTPNPFTVVQNGTPTTIADAVGVGELLSNLDSDHVSAVCNMKATAGLGISAKVDGKTLASGSVAVNWPTVFEDDSCEPDFSTLVVDADDDFDVSLRDFDPFPSVTGKHTGDGDNDHLLDDTKDFTKVGFTIGAPTSPTGGNNLQNLTLRNETTGASCTILTVVANELGCTLSGGTRAGDVAHANKWMKGDEYLVEGNALAWLGYILDNLDKLVEQVDKLAPGVTDKELPLVGISTKDLVGKIKAIKQTTDELRGSPLGQIDCTQFPNAPNNEGFDLTQLPRGTKIYCKTITTVVPTVVKWTVLESPGGANAVTIGTGAESLDTVGSSPSGRVEVTVGDPTQVPVSGPVPLIAISDWQIKVEFTDAAGNHNTEFPTSSPPTSLQGLADAIEDKLGVDNILKLEVLDLPKAGAGARKSGTATAGVTADNVLEDTGGDFLSGDDDHRVFIGNLVVNKSDKTHCTVTAVTATTVTCAAGSNMQWNGAPSADEYDIVGDNTKDLVVRLGVGFCSGGAALSEPCKATDRPVDALEAPLNVKDDFANIVSVDADASIKLDYAARAQFDVGIPIKLGIPDVTVLDTSGASLEAAVDAPIGLSAAIGPVSVELGTKVAGGTGVGKLGAKLGLPSDDDDVPNNKTMSFGDFFSAIGSNASFEGLTQNCDGGPPDTTGHACAVLNVALLGVDQGQLKISCNIVSGAPDCDAELPAGLEALINGSELDWTLLLQVAQQILTKLETTLDGAAQDVKLPLIGNALDAGADVVGAFNTKVVTPFNTLVQQIKTTADQDGDGSADAYDASKFVQKFIFDNLGPTSTAHILQDTNGVGGATPTMEDVVVTPLCGTPAVPCANGASITTIRDFRITFKIGQGIDGDVPFDIGLKGVPLRLTGGVHGSGSWSLLVDMGLSFQAGPYIVANGKPGFTGTEDRDFDADCDGDPGNDCYGAVKFLQDDGTDFNGPSNADPADDIVEIGMWLKKTGTDQGCRVTKVEEHKLFCTDFGLDDDAPAVTWNGTDGYELIARHAPDGPATGSASELQLKGLVSMSDAATACDETGSLPDYLAANFTGIRCLEGQIAFLKVNVRDRDGTLDPSADCDTLFTADGEEPTALCLNASLDFQKAGGSTVGLSDLISGNFGFKPKLSGAANIDVRIRTGLNVNQSAGFPSVLGKFHLFWGFSITTGEPVSVSSLDVHLDGLNLDAGTFITEFLGPMIKQVKDVTNPLMPVVELLQGEVPIISDLSKLIGQGPVTVLDVLEAISGNDLSLMRSILQMIKFVNALPSDGALLIPLGSGDGGGSFAITHDRATGSPPLPDDPDQGITGVGGAPQPDGGKNLLDKLGSNSSPYSSAKTQPAECDRGATFGVCGLTFPFFGDAGQIFGVLMGKDATLIHYDAGSFGAGAGFGFCFPPILIGPVPVQICIGGSFRVDGRFAMGYDTSGLRKVLAGGTGTHLLDGIFFDDYDANGVDVPEVKFTGTVYAEGAVSVYIFKVGIRGEIIFTTGLNLHEDAPQDGKLRIEEVIAKIFNPVCLFDVEGKIEAALSAFVKIDLFITSVEFSIQIVKVTLLEFDLSVCNVKPVLAHVSGDNLVLNMGSSSLRTARGIAPQETNEKFTVRQMGPRGSDTRFSVSAFGIQQDYFLPTSKVDNGTSKLIADAEDGNDVISLLPGSEEGEQSDPNSQKPPIPFKLKAQITGGSGDDEITTGDGDDDVNGGDNNDTISTGVGVDKIAGAGGADKIDAGAGEDVDVHGNTGNDVVNGGPGADKLFGDEEDDVLNGGPGDSGTSVDELTGGTGNDTLNADGGGDKLWGDEGGLSFDCTADSGNDGAGGGGKDSLIGAAGNDQMHGGTGDDTLDGAEGDDKMCGGGGNDEMKGGAGVDAMSGNGDDDNLVGSTDGSTGDTMNGNGGRDYMIGDDGSLTRDAGNNVSANVVGGTAGGTDTMKGGPGRDFMWGQGAVDTMNGNTGNDEMHGGPADDVMRGDEDDDEMYGDDGVDTMHGDANDDYMRGGTNGDHMDGDAGNDEMYGDNDVDDMRGGANDDLMRGGGGDDLIEGNGNDSSALPLDDAASPIAGVNFDLHLEKDALTGAWTKVGGGDGDVVYGDAGQDDIIGGSSSTAADDGDTILGNTEQDVIVGDNGTIARPAAPVEPDQTVARAVTLLDPAGAVAGNSGGDWIQGNLGNDDVYAGGGGDLVHGDEGDDYVEGNGGSDGDGDLDTTPDAAIGLYGDVGQDDLIGGTSQGDGGVADGADDVWGGQGHDVAAGDNADITRTGGGTCGGFVCNTFRAGDVVDVVIRRIQVWDVDDQAAGDPAAGMSGGDMIGGQDGHDRLYGQGGGDRIEGGGNDDFAFGNAGSDTINGNDGQDDLVGGTGRTDSSSPSSAADGRIDAGDVIQGQDDFDSISGDNARVVRQTLDADANDNTGLWKANTFNNAVDRLIALMDVATAADAAPLGNGTSGNDELLGGDEDDVVYGQGGNDGISGGPAQDLLEGNANGTGNAPDPAGTYGLSWPTFAGDVIHGDAGADDVGGGTGRIYRMVSGVETQDPVSGIDGRRDGGDTIFGDDGGDALAGDNTVIERALQGGQWILDDLSPDALDVVRRIMRERDVATTSDLAPLTNGTSGGDVIYGNNGVDVAYGQGGDDQIQGNADDDHLEGNANDDTITGNEGQDDVIGGTGRQFSNVETGASGAADGRVDNPTTDDAPNDTLHGGNGLGAVASADDDAIIGDNGTIDRELGNPIPTLDKLPFNGTWTPTSWDEPSIRRVIRLLDVATTANTAPETNGTNGDDAINGEANEDLLFGQGGNDVVTGDDAELLAPPAPADASPGDDYIEGNGGLDTLRGDLGEDDIAGGGSAANGVLDANRDGELNPDRSGETLRDAGDLITGDSGDPAIGDGDVVGGDNVRIYRKLDGAGDWRPDAQRGTTLRDVFLFDIEVVGGADAADGESGVDSIFGNGGRDLLFGQDNGTDVNAYGNESVVGDGNGGGANCQNATGGPGSGTVAGLEEAPSGDDDNDDLPDLNDPQCRDDQPGDKVLGQHADDYMEGNQGSDSLEGGEGEDDVIGGSSANTGHVNAILPPADRDAGFAPTALLETSKPNNLADGHDVIQGNAEDDTVLGDNGFVDRYLAPSTGNWVTIVGAGHAAVGELDVPNPEPAKAAYEASDMVRRDVTTKATIELGGAFGNDYIRGGTGQDDVYGTLGNDWLEGNENEDAIVADMGKIVDNVLGQDDPIDPVDPAQQFIVPQQPFLGATINQTGVLKREVTLYAFNQIASPATAGIGHDVALGGDGNDWIHTGPGEDLANGNAGDDRIFLGDNFTAITAGKTGILLAHDRVDAGWGGLGYDHVWGGYGADYSDVRPRTAAEVPGLFPASDPETWFQIAGAGPNAAFPPPAPQELSENGVNYAHGNDNFGDKDYHYGGWDQDTLQANIGDNGPHIGDRLLDWGGSYNGYYLCPSTYGDWVSTRAIAPGLIEFLQQMSQGDGATQTATTTSSGFRETAIVFSNEVKDNTKPIHADTPAHFTCGPGTTGP